MTVYVPAQEPPVVASEKFKVTELPHASVAVAVAKTGVDGQLMVVGAGSTEMTGGVTSCTLMVCEAVDELPHISVAVQVLFTEYDPAQDPWVVTLTNESEKGLSHSSIAVATANTGVAGQLIVVGAGRGLITGAVASTTLIV